MLWRFWNRFFWAPVYLSSDLEIEYNKKSGAYRHRSITSKDCLILEGPWVEGFPDPIVRPISLDELRTPEEMARCLVPLWGNDDKRKADNDR